MLVDVDATPDLKVYDAYIKSLGCKQHEWTDAAVRALRDAAETSR
jgi:ribosome-binding factor A